MSLLPAAPDGWSADTPPGAYLFELEADVRRASVPERFRKIAARLPGATAYTGMDGRLSYAELDQLSDRLAAGLLARLGPGPEPVVLLLPHQASSLVGMLGVMKAGKFYVPLDPNQSVAALGQVLLDCSARLLLCTSGLDSQAQAVLAASGSQAALQHLEQATAGSAPLAAHEHRLLGQVRLGDQDIASLQYTSGSTRTPKGVIRPHATYLYTAYLRARFNGLDARDRVSHILSYAYGISMTSIFGALLTGATVCALEYKSMTPEALVGWLRQERVSIWISSSTALRQVVESMALGGSPVEPLPDLRRVLFFGDTLYAEDVRRVRPLLPPGCLAVNALGTTETGTLTDYTFSPDQVFDGPNVPIGRFIPMYEISLLDDAGQPVNPGEPGEMVVRGRYISLGYWQRPEQTSAGFRLDPAHPDRRTYYTGDLARLRPDGLVEHLGRKDFVVKVRGYRVELELIDQALRSIPEVSDCVTVAERADPDAPPGEATRLVAYLVCRPSQRPPGADELRRWLSAQLPEYSLPSVFIWLPVLPLTSGGKVDRKALPIPSSSRPNLAAPYQPPLTSLEKQLCAIWEQVLGVAPVGMDDSFFDLGGYSLAAGRIAARLQAQCQVTLTIQEFFNLGGPAGASGLVTVRRLAELVLLRQAQALDPDALQTLLDEIAPGDG